MATGLTMPNDIRIPDSEYVNRVHGFIKEAIEEGTAFVQCQTGFSKIAESIDAVMGEQTTLRSSTLSQTSSNQFGKITGDLAAMLTDIKPFWEFRTKNERYGQTARVYGDLSTLWYPQRFIDLRMSEVIKYCLVASSAYAHMVWDEDLYDINVIAEDPRDVLPIRPTSNETIQSAFGVIVRRSMTLNYLRSVYPESVWGAIKHDRDGSMISRLSNTRIGRLFQSALEDTPFRRRLFGDEPAKTIPRIPTCDIYTVYLKDRTRNKSGRPVFVGDFDKDTGQPKNNWSYAVQPGGLKYPRGRMIVATNYGILRDGPNQYWHGWFPLCKLTLDPWPWSWFGKAVMWDVLPLQRSYDFLWRVIDDHMQKAARPDVIADKNSISKASLDKIDTRRPGLKMQQNPLIGKGITIQYQPPLPPEVYAQLERTKTEMREIAGVSDLSQLLSLNQIPSQETVDRIIQNMTPTVRGRSRVIEAFVREFATMLAYNFSQFYTPAMRSWRLGEAGYTQQDMDSDRGTLVPDYTDSDYGEDGALTPERLAAGPRPRYERAREFIRQFTFHVTPGSMLSASGMMDKMMYLQLARAGVIDTETLMEKLEIPNIKQIKERLAEERGAGLGMMVNAAGRKATGQEGPRLKMSESG